MIKAYFLIVIYFVWAIAPTVALQPGQPVWNTSILTFEDAKGSADHGDAYAQAVVSIYYSLGWKTEKNVEMALKYALASAKAGNPLGVYRVGTALRNGDGTEKSEQQGLALQQKSFDGLNKMTGNPYAITSVGVMLFQGKIVQENKQEAVRLYKIAADMGYAPAQYNYAMALNDGHGLTRDPQTRDNYLQKASQLGYPLALQWVAKNDPLATVRSNGASTDLRGSPSSEPSAGRATVSMSSVRRHLKAENLKAMTPVVQEAPERIYSVDVSGDQKRIAVQTVNKLFLYEVDGGRLLKSFENMSSDGVYFRSGEKDRVLLVNRGDKKISELNTTSGQVSSVASKVQGTPIGYNSSNDTLILFADSSGKGGALSGNVIALSLQTGIKATLGNIHSQSPALSNGLGLRALFDSNGQLGIAGFFNDGMEGIGPINLFARRKDSAWVIKSGDSAADDMKEFLNLPESFRCLGKDIYGHTQSVLTDKHLLFDKLRKITESDVISLDDSFLSAVYSPSSKAALLASIPSGTVRRIDGLSASEDGSRLAVWNINEEWLKSKFAPEHGNFYFRTQREAMDLPPVLIDTKNFSSFLAPIGERVVWSSALAVSGDSVMMVVSDKQAKPFKVNDPALQLDDSPSAAIDTHAMVLSYPALSARITDTVAPVSYPFENNDGQLRVWLRGQTDISVDNASFSDEAGRWLFDSGGQPELMPRGRQVTSNPESFAKISKTGSRVLVKNVTAFNAKGGYEFSALVTLVKNDSTLVGSLQLDDNVESAFPIEMTKVLVVAGGTIFIFDFEKNEVVSALKTGKLDTREKILSVCPTSRLLWYREPSGQSIRLVSWDSSGFLSESLRVYPQLQGAPVYLTNDRFYASLNRGQFGLHFSDSERTYPFEQFDLRLNRPDIVLERLGAPPDAIAIAKELREKRLKRMGVTEDMLKPDFHLPELQIVEEVPASTPKDQIDLQIKAADDKYPLDRLRVYVNNVPVNGRDGELLRDQKAQSLERTIPVKLAAGRNKIQVSVLNSAGAESLYANADVTCTAEHPKPKLYAVAIGVSQYDRPEWCLKYAVKDATDLVNQVKAKAGSAYSEVKPFLLTDKDVTKESAGKIKDFLSGATIDDTVLVFMAGHGILDDKYDYYFGTTDIDPEKPAERGMPYDAIDTILADVPSLKKALLMDTCHAGELDADERKELANEEGKGSAPSAPDASLSGKVAMRAIGTRGMSVKGIGGGKGKSDWYEKLQDMFVDLRRGSGATVISSSQGAEYAFESSEQSNGLFTYALMEALDGKAEKNKDGQITISAVGDYVKKRVQDLTKGKQTPNLRGVNLEEDFPLASTK